jgi:phosphopantothenoylcysteine decarboxylase/phosphopantothenate--cysteine ligase
MTVSDDQTLIGYDDEQQLVVQQGNAALADLITRIAGQDAPQHMLKAAPYNGPALLAGRHVVVTSGRTHEDLTDNGDVITNFASGKQGHAVALSLAQMGAQVTLVTGPASVAVDHPLIDTVTVRTAAELQQACLRSLPADAAVCVCAVGDFKAAGVPDIIAGGYADLPFTQNPDTLKTLGLHPTLRPAVVIGFAAETHDLLHYAEGKLRKKGADAICANQVGAAMQERGSSRNQIHFVTASGVDTWDDADKAEIGFKIGDAIARLLAGKRPEPGANPAI